jgi:hypothetical protein
MRNLTIAPMLVFALVAFTQADFCKGFNQGYFVGYRHASGKDPDAIPECPMQQYKDADWEQGFRIGSQQGLKDGQR